jgi:hypothetical protein
MGYFGYSPPQGLLATVIANGAVGGPLLLGDGTKTAPAYSFASDTDTGLYRSGTNLLSITLGDTEIIRFGGSASEGIMVRNPQSIGWEAGDGTFSSSDAKWFRDGANIIAQRNGTNAQEYRVYNTFTSSTNGEFGKLEWVSTIFNVQTEAGSGGGTARAMLVGAGTAVGTDIAGSNTTIVGGRGTGGGIGGSILFDTVGSGAAGSSANALINRWKMDESGNILAGSDGIPSIGASGATRPGKIFVASAFVHGLGATSLLGTFGAAAASQQVRGANVTVTIATAGTANTIASITNTALGTGSANGDDVRAAVYQLASMFKDINDGLRVYGLFT